MKGECDPSPSEFDQNNQNQAEKSSCTKSKKSSGLKRIAKQVIDIIKLRQRMTYPQVAYIVVQMNLKKEDVAGESVVLPKGLDDEEDFDKDEDIDVPDSAFWDESNLATSAKKQKKKKGAQTLEGGDDEDDNGEVPRHGGRRSRQESNLRRRIYDAWNVLKAASIIVE